jgi:hypothetical protein
MKQPSEFTLLRFRQVFEASGNPRYAWAALGLCTDQKPLPRWLMEYLVQCSERMQNADQASDLRKILPRVLGFPTKRAKKSWGDKINPRMWKFVTEFGVRILYGDDPRAARRNGCNAAFASKVADRLEDKTLMRWLHQAYLLKKEPKDAQQWKEIVLAFAEMLGAQKQFANMEMTPGEAAKAAETADDVIRRYGTFLREILP